MKADPILLSTVAIAGGTTALRQITNKQNDDLMRTALGTFAFGTLLFLIQLINTEVARAMGILVAISSILVNGSTVFNAISKAVR